MSIRSLCCANSEHTQFEVCENGFASFLHLTGGSIIVKPESLLMHTDGVAVDDDASFAILGINKYEY
jgi:hypothetical protein